MSTAIKQSTVRTMVFGPFLDDADGVTEITTLAGVSPERSKAGSSFGVTTNNLSALVDGFYTLALSTADTDTLGELVIKIMDPATHLPVWRYFDVIPANVWDSLYDNGDLLDVQVSAIDASAITPTSIATDAITDAKIAPNAITSSEIADNAITNTKFALNAINSAVLATDAITNLQIATSAITADGIATDAIGSLELSAAAANKIRDTILNDATTFAGGSIDAAITTRATPAQVNTEVDDVLATDARAEPVAVPAANASTAVKIDWLFQLARNRLIQTSGLQTVRNDGDLADVATAVVTSDGSTTVRAKFT